MTSRGPSAGLGQRNTDGGLQGSRGLARYEIVHHLDPRRRPRRGFFAAEQRSEIVLRRA